MACIIITVQGLCQGPLKRTAWPFAKHFNPIPAGYVQISETQAEGSALWISDKRAFIYHASCKDILLGAWGS
jgi:hypothetical protein